MDADSSRVMVTVGATAESARVFHHAFPEIRAEGRTAKEAATHLANLLSLALDTALTNWRRETLARAVADVNAFLMLPE